MKKLIDITTTATLRPEILDETYQSFWEHIFEKHKDKYHYHLIINIDPIGDNRYDYEDVLNVAKKYFNDITYNAPFTPSFSQAYKWVWEQTTSKYVFNLEDMWTSETKMNLDNLVYIIDEYPKIAWVHLFKGIIGNGDSSPFFYHTYKKLEDQSLFIQVEKPMASPGLFGGDFIRGLEKLMNATDNPELQLWGDKYQPGDSRGKISLRQYLSKWEYAVYTRNWILPFWEGRIAEVDMSQGRRWKEKHNITKKDHFAPWEKE